MSRSASAIDPLVLDFVEWVAAGPRSRAEVIEVWKTSCPRLTVWEDAADRGFVTRIDIPGRGLYIGLTPVGRAVLAARKHGRIS